MSNKTARSHRLDVYLLERMERIHDSFLVVVILVGLAILAAWCSPSIAGLLPADWSSMTASTALCVLLGGAALLVGGRRFTLRQRFFSRSLGLLILIIAGSALVGIRTGKMIDLFSVVEPSRTDLGPMSMQNASYMTMLGLSLLFLNVRQRVSTFAVDALIMALLLLPFVMLSGYCFEASDLFAQSSVIRTSPQMLVCMLFLSVSAAGFRAEYGFFAVLVSVGIGSRVARMILPVTLVMPALLTYIDAYLAKMGWLPATDANALTVVLISALLSVLTVVMAWRINWLERDLRDISLTDELTRTYNRRGFFLLGESAMRQAQRNGSNLTVLFFDLDGLKQINDSQGHDVGSQFLVDAASLLKENFRGVDVVGRIGGDEFAVVTHGDSDGARQALERIDAAARALDESRTRQYAVSYSVGIASRKSSKETFLDLVNRADTLMYAQKQHKQRGQN